MRFISCAHDNFGNVWNVIRTKFHVTLLPVGIDLHLVTLWGACQNCDEYQTGSSLGDCSAVSQSVHATKGAM